MTLLEMLRTKHGYFISSFLTFYRRWTKEYHAIDWRVDNKWHGISVNVYLLFLETIRYK